MLEKIKRSFCIAYRVSGGVQFGNYPMLASDDASPNGRVPCGGRQFGFGSIGHATAYAETCMSVRDQRDTCAELRA